MARSPRRSTTSNGVVDMIRIKKLSTLEANIYVVMNEKDVAGDIEILTAIVY